MNNLIPRRCFCSYGSCCRSSSNCAEQSILERTKYEDAVSTNIYF